MGKINERMRIKLLEMHTKQTGVHCVGLLFVCLKVFSIINEKEIYI